jgi:NAD+ kinase
MQRPVTEPARRLSVDADPRKPDAVALAEQMRAWLQSRAAYAPDVREADVQVVLGGDGTVVRAARASCEVPVLGIDFGQFGFLAHVPQTRWEARLAQELTGDYDVREDPTLDVFIERGQQVLCTLWAIQDVVFHAYVVPGNGQQMTLLELYLDGKYSDTIPGDGLIVANGPGSSAYNLAAGGPVLAPGTASFAVTPICAHMPPKHGSFGVPVTTPITVIQNGRFPINVCVDGQDTFDDFAPGDVAHVQADPRRFRLVTFRDVSFYDRFHKRFNYRVRPGARSLVATPGTPAPRRSGEDREGTPSGCQVSRARCSNRGASP